MRSRLAGTTLAAAAALFWVSWLLMPGVGVTDARRIFDLVGTHRTWVACSVAAQLVSAVLYVPALVALVSDPALAAARSIRIGAGLLLVGASGSAADAVYHLLAYAMTAPGLDLAALVPVMEFMQGPGLAVVAPLILAFFVGTAWLAVAFAGHGLVARAAAWLVPAALAVGFVGGRLATAQIVPSRIVGLAVLALVAGAQAWLGIAIACGREPSAARTSGRAPHAS